MSIQQCPKCEDGEIEVRVYDDEFCNLYVEIDAQTCGCDLDTLTASELADLAEAAHDQWHSAGV